MEIALAGIREPRERNEEKQKNDDAGNSAANHLQAEDDEEKKSENHRSGRPAPRVPVVHRKRSWLTQCNELNHKPENEHSRRDKMEHAEGILRAVLFRDRVKDECVEEGDRKRDGPRKRSFRQKRSVSKATPVRRMTRPRRRMRKVSVRCFSGIGTGMFPLFDILSMNRLKCSYFDSLRVVINKKTAKRRVSRVPPLERSSQGKDGPWKENRRFAFHEVIATFSSKNPRRPEGDHSDDARDREEGKHILRHRQTDVHAVETCDEDRKEREDVDDREDADDGVRFVAQEGFVRFVQRLAHFFCGFKERPLALDGVQNIVKVDAKIGHDELLVLVLQDRDERSLRLDDAAHGDDVAFYREDIPVHVRLLLFQKVPPR